MSSIARVCHTTRTLSWAPKISLSYTRYYTTWASILLACRPWWRGGLVIWWCGTDQQQVVA